MGEYLHLKETKKEFTYTIYNCSSLRVIQASLFIQYDCNRGDLNFYECVQVNSKLNALRKKKRIQENLSKFCKLK